MSLPWPRLTPGLAAHHSHNDFAAAILNLLSDMQPALHLHRPVIDLLRELLYAFPRSSDVCRHFATLHGASILYALWAAHSPFPMDDHLLLCGTLASLEPIFWPNASPPLLHLAGTSPASFEPLHGTTSTESIHGAASTCRNVFARLASNLADTHSPSLEACLSQGITINSSTEPFSCPPFSAAVFASTPSPVLRTAVHMLHGVRIPGTENNRLINAC